MKIDLAINDYLLNSNATKKQNTCIWEEKTFRSFKSFAEKYNYSNLEDIDKKVLLDYIGFERSRGLQNVTLNKKIDLVKRMFTYHEISSNIMSVKKLRETKKTVDRLSDGELNLLLSYLSSLDDEIGNNFVYKTIFFFILDSGCRIDETLKIKKRNINFKHQIIHLDETKFSKERFIDFSSYTKRSLMKMHDLHSGDYLFWNVKKNRQLNYESDIQYFYRKVSKELGVKKMTSHRLRHTFASISAQNGMNVLSLKEILGHENIRTTQIYMHANRNKTKMDYNKYSPFSSKAI